MKRPKVKSFGGCEVPELAQRIYEHSFNKLYDEVGGDNGFGWYGLVVYHTVPYIIQITPDGQFSYHAYKNQSAATKAWDHICLKWERWYVRRNG